MSALGQKRTYLGKKRETAARRSPQIFTRLADAHATKSEVPPQRTEATLLTILA